LIAAINANPCAHTQHPVFWGLVPALFLWKPRQSTVATDCYASRETV